MAGYSGWGGIASSLRRLVFQEVCWLSSLDFPINLSLGLHTIWECGTLCPDLQSQTFRAMLHLPALPLASLFASVQIFENFYCIIKKDPVIPPLKEKKKSKAVRDIKANPLPGL